MRIAGPALHVSLLLVTGSFATSALVGCAASHTSDALATDGETVQETANGQALAPAPVVERAGSPSLRQDDQLAQDAELLSLKEQKERLLFEAALARANELKAGLKLEDALVQVDRAVSINPENLQAKQLRSELLALLGRPEGIVGAGMMDRTGEIGIKLEQIRLSVKRDLNDAKLALARGDYDSAIGDLSIAKTNIEVNGFDIEWDGIDAEVRTLLEQSVADRERAEEMARDEKRREAFVAPPYKYTRGTMYRYIKTVSSAQMGCVTDE